MHGYGRFARSAFFITHNYNMRQWSALARFLPLLYGDNKRRGSNGSQTAQFSSQVSRLGIGLRRKIKARDQILDNNRDELRTARHARLTVNCGILRFDRARAGVAHFGNIRV